MAYRNRKTRGRTFAITGLMVVAAAGASVFGVTAAHAEDGPVVTKTGTSTDPDRGSRLASANNSALAQALQECKNRGYTSYTNTTSDDEVVEDDGKTATVTYTVTCTR
jgi:hypothetical protein